MAPRDRSAGSAPTTAVIATAIALALATLAGCVDPLKGTSAQATPAFYVDNVKGYGETAAGLPPDEVLAYDLTVVGDIATYRECSSPMECGTVTRTRPAADLLGVVQVGESSVEGRKVDVVKLSLTPPPKYIVPNWKPN